MSISAPIEVVDKMDASSSPAISMTGLTKFYGPHLGVEDISFDVFPGEVVGFVGPNGSGKTTVMRMLLTLIHITRGSAQLLGVDVSQGAHEIRQKVGYLPGTLGLYKNMNVGEYLRFISQMRGGNFDNKIIELSERLSLRLAADIGDLSKGNKQKVGVVQAFMHTPKILILDEPTSGLDPLVQREFELILAEARDNGAAVLLSSHVMHEVESLASRVAIINKGHLVLLDSVESLKARTVHTLRFTFPYSIEEVSFQKCYGVKKVFADGCNIECAVVGPQNEVLKLAADMGVLTVTAEPPSLEDIFLSATGKNRDS